MELRKLIVADYSAEIFELYRKMKRGIISSFFSFSMRVKCKFMRVNVGHDVRFNGYINIERFKHSIITIGDNCVFNSKTCFNARGIAHHCIISTATDYAKIEIGNNCGFSGTSIVANNYVKIGNNVTVGADSCIGDRDDHNNLTKTLDKPVEIKDNVFIGMHCLILKGVTIGENSIIGAGSVVTKDIPANCVAAGVPCKVIRYLDK